MNPTPNSPRTPIATLLLAAALLGGCSDSDDDDDSSPVSTPVANFDAGLAVDWFTLLHASVRTEALNPPVASRRIAYASVAFYEGLVNGMPDHRSMGEQLNGLDELPARPAGVMHWPSVANQAMATVMLDLFTGASQPTLDNIAALRDSTADVYDDTVSAAVITRSIDYGDELAAAIIAWSQTDGFTTWNNCAYTVPIGPGLWAPTPPAFVANPLQPCWGNLRPFALLYAAECSPLPHPAYSTSTTSPFYAEALEVYNVVNAADPDQIAIAQFWADGGGSLTPPGHWVSILCQVCDQEDYSLDLAAEAAAKVGIGVADAFISCWEMKYHYNLLRPISYIRDGAGPINDGAWVTVAGVGTPPFPEYTSGHSVQSGAASLLLQDLFGAVAFTDDTHNGTFPARSFTSFLEASNEAAVSRLYGGIHYRAACERGVEQGYCIAQTILDNVQFRD
jgi:hypothetical protein